jgi:hypothetical protein
MLKFFFNMDIIFRTLIYTFLEIYPIVDFFRSVWITVNTDSLLSHFR